MIVLGAKAPISAVNCLGDVFGGSIFTRVAVTAGCGSAAGGFEVAASGMLPEIDTGGAACNASPKVPGSRWEFTPRLVTGREMADFSGFNLYRRGEGELFSFFPLNPDLIKENRYQDAVLENGKRYYYEVRAVRNFRGTLIESLSSAVASGIPKKITPPSPPTGLVAATQKEGVALRWNPNPEPDIGGYNVYRREKGESAFTNINPQLITEQYFLDKEADPHKTYFYRLTAVDNSQARNESEFSKEVEVSP